MWFEVGLRLPTVGSEGETMAGTTTATVRTENFLPLGMFQCWIFAGSIMSALTRGWGNGGLSPLPNVPGAGAVSNQEHARLRTVSGKQLTELKV